MARLLIVVVVCLFSAASHGWTHSEEKGYCLNDIPKCKEQMLSAIYTSNNKYNYPALCSFVLPTRDCLLKLDCSKEPRKDWIKIEVDGVERHAKDCVQRSLLTMDQVYPPTTQAPTT